MVEESDGIQEAVEAQLRVFVTAAGRAGELLARAREQAAREAQARSEHDARELASRLEAERRVTHAELGNVFRNQWWDTATPQQIAGTYQTARAWSGQDPEAARADTRIREELATRYGINENAFGTRVDPVAVREAVERAEQARGQSERSRHLATEDAEAARLLSEANRADHARNRTHSEDVGEHAAGVDATPLYDSAARRQAVAADLEAKGVSAAAISARMRADVSQAKPATAATTPRPGTAPPARITHGRTPRAQRDEPSR